MQARSTEFSILGEEIAKEHLTDLVITQLDPFSLRLKNLLTMILKVEQIQALTQLVVKLLQMQNT